MASSAPIVAEGNGLLRNARRTTSPGGDFSRVHGIYQQTCDEEGCVTADAAQIELPIDAHAGMPVIGSAHTPVGEIVRVCHARTIDDGLTELAIDELDRTTLEPVLVYCAEERCIADGVTCPGCTKRVEAEGITSFDRFVAGYREIVIGNGAVRIAGEGEARIARRQPRKRRRRRGVARTTGSGRAASFASCATVSGARTCRARPCAGDGETPCHPADGAAARRQHRHGGARHGQLRPRRSALVAPRDGWPNEKARIAASGANYIIDDAAAFPTLDAAIGDLNWLAATTARQRDLRKPVLTPIEAVAEMRRRIDAGERCGVLFGRERSGLETSEVANADALIMIPVNSRFASLNLAQAVLILGYEWMRASDAESLAASPLTRSLWRPALHGRRPAGDEGRSCSDSSIISRLSSSDSGFFNPSHKRATVVRNLRTMFSRMGATEQEVRTLRGIVATLAKGKGHARKPSN